MGITLPVGKIHKKLIPKIVIDRLKGGNED